MVNHVVAFIPSEEDKMIAQKYVNKVIDVLKPINPHLKYFVLKSLMDGFPVEYLEKPYLGGEQK